jgi:hypothetical protein
MINNLWRAFALTLSENLMIIASHFVTLTAKSTFEFGGNKVKLIFITVSLVDYIYR